MRSDLVNEMKADDVGPVNLEIPFSPIRGKAPVLRRGARMLIPVNFKITRILLFLIPCFFGVAAFASDQAHAPVADKSAAAVDASKYVGAETCKTCHEEIYNAWEKTPHWKTTLNKDAGTPRLRRLPWARRGPRGRRRRHDQDIQSREALGQRG